MRLLIVEYITGGGFLNQQLPASLAAEGGLMLQALLDELRVLPDLQLQLLLDPRCRGFALPAHCQPIWLDPQHAFESQLSDGLQGCDAIWPIAPESDDILASIAEIAQGHGKRLLLSSPEAIRLCGDKYATFRRLRQYEIPTVATHLLHRNPVEIAFPAVLKPRDGVGCEGSIIVADAQAYRLALRNIAHFEHYLWQPLVDGDALSLSCLFRNGKASLISCNRQLVERRQNGFQLQGCEVNIDGCDRDGYQALANRIGAAIPGLWGYIGIDLIDHPGHGPQVLEINPRLTTSYVGLQAATGINVAAWVLQMLDGEIRLPAAERHTITVTIHRETI